MLRTMKTLFESHSPIEALRGGSIIVSDVSKGERYRNQVLPVATELIPILTTRPNVSILWHGKNFAIEVVICQLQNLSDRSLLSIRPVDTLRDTDGDFTLAEPIRTLAWRQPQSLEWVFRTIKLNCSIRHRSSNAKPLARWWHVKPMIIISEFVISHRPAS